MVVITLPTKEAPTKTTDKQGDLLTMAPSLISINSPAGQSVTKPAQALPWGTLTLLACGLTRPRVGPHVADGLSL